MDLQQHGQHQSDSSIGQDFEGEYQAVFHVGGCSFWLQEKQKLIFFI